MAALLSLQGVGVAYRRGRRDLQVLMDVSLDLAPGEVLTVLAMRAQGASTLLRVAAGMQQPGAGRVLFDGENLWGLPDRRRQRLLREGVGWVKTGAPDVDVPVLELLATPLLVGGHGTRTASLRAKDALQRVGAADCAGQRWEALSEWERALVALAIGIVREPRLLVVDDLTSALGLEETDEAMHMLHSLARERRMGVLAGVSDANATQWSDRLATLAGGELVLAPDPGEGSGEALGDVVRLRDNRRRTGS